MSMQVRYTRVRGEDSGMNQLKLTQHLAQICVVNIWILLSHPLPLYFGPDHEGIHGSANSGFCSARSSNPYLHTLLGAGIARPLQPFVAKARRVKRMQGVVVLMGMAVLLRMRQGLLHHRLRLESHRLCLNLWQ